MVRHFGANFQGGGGEEGGGVGVKGTGPATPPGWEHHAKQCPTCMPGLHMAVSSETYYDLGEHITTR